MLQLVSHVICLYDIASYGRPNAYDNNIPSSSCYFRRFLKLRKSTSGFVIPVRLSAAPKCAWSNSASIERIVVEVYFADNFFQICTENSSVVKMGNEYQAFYEYMKTQGCLW